MVMDSIVASVFAEIAGLLDSLEALIAAWLPSQRVPAYVAFSVYVLFILGGGLAAVAARNLVRALTGLILTFLGVAGMYLLLASPFLAFMQLLIYVGAVCVLVFFAIMTTANTPEGEESSLPSPAAAIRGLLAFLAPLAVLAPLLIMETAKLPQVAPERLDATALGRGLIGEDMVPFELISIILLAAMAGAVFLAFRRRGSGKRA
jgi:NADH-quinone oxidoreductase subunit J